MRTEFMLKCTVCNNENYNYAKNKKNHPDRMEAKKFCKKCGKQTMHKEKK